MVVLRMPAFHKAGWSHGTEIPSVGHAVTVSITIGYHFFIGFSKKYTFKP